MFAKVKQNRNLLDWGWDCVAILTFGGAALVLLPFLWALTVTNKVLAFLVKWMHNRSIANRSTSTCTPQLPVLPL
jgi:hypothetical protein